MTLVERKQFRLARYFEPPGKQADLLLGEQPVGAAAGKQRREVTSLDLKWIPSFVLLPSPSSQLVATKRTGRAR